MCFTLTTYFSSYPPVIPNHWEIFTELASHWGLNLRIFVHSAHWDKRKFIMFFRKFWLTFFTFTYIVYNLKISWLKNSSAFTLSSLIFLYQNLVHSQLQISCLQSHKNSEHLLIFSGCLTVIFSSPVLTPACFQIPRNRNILKEEMADICSSPTLTLYKM